VTGALPSTSPPNIDPLCQHPAVTPAPAASPTQLPKAISDVAGQVEQVRGLKFERPVTPEPVSQRRIAQLLADALAQSFPREMQDRREKAWETIGVLPKGTDLYQAVIDLQGSQVIGFYDTISHKLVFIGSENPTPYQRYTLAHELTHALDDQHFNLSRLDVLQNSCQDERLAALSSLVEGNAVETQVRWAGRYLTPEDIQRLLEEQRSFPPPPAGIPEFVQNLFIFPYPNGQRFVEALMAKGGEEAVNRAMRNPPVSTEQILHPDKYPGDRPVATTAPDIASELGEGWMAVDFEDVGEGWLETMLALRLTQPEATEGADGWDGGQYRAWSKDDQTVVEMKTEWDTVEEAQQFDEDLRKWLGDQPATLRFAGSNVTAYFGSDASLMPLLRQLAT